MVLMNTVSTVLWQAQGCTWFSMTGSRSMLFLLLAFPATQLACDTALIKGVPPYAWAVRLEVISSASFVAMAGLLWKAGFDTPDHFPKAYMYLAQATMCLLIIIGHALRVCCDGQCWSTIDGTFEPCRVFLWSAIAERDEKNEVLKYKRKLEQNRKVHLSRAKSLSAAFFLLAAGFCFVIYPTMGTSPKCVTDDEEYELAVIIHLLVMCVVVFIMLVYPSEHLASGLYLASYMYMLCGFQFPVRPPPHHCYTLPCHCHANTALAPFPTPCPRSPFTSPPPRCSSTHLRSRR
jgi:hypothetical protein